MSGFYTDDGQIKFMYSFATKRQIKELDLKRGKLVLNDKKTSRIIKKNNNKYYSKIECGSKYRLICGTVEVGGEFGETSCQLVYEGETCVNINEEQDLDFGDGSGGNVDSDSGDPADDWNNPFSCPPGKTYNLVTGTCECIGDNMVEDSNGNCVFDCTKFDEVIKNVLNIEGGYVNDPTDPGGATNKGISWQVWKKHSNSVLGVTPTLQNLQNITTAQAKNLYKALYWDTLNADSIDDGDLRYLLFDFNVNAGSNAIKVLQQTLNLLGSNINIDGKIGTQTIDAINGHNDQVLLYNTYKTNRINYYNKITQNSINRYIAKNPSATQNQIDTKTLKKFINGWVNRTNHFKNKTSTNSLNVNC